MIVLGVDVGTPGVRALTRIRQRVTPQPERARRYDEEYQRFLAAGHAHGWHDAASV